jgi:hypothetical protein
LVVDRTVVEDRMGAIEHKQIRRTCRTQVAHKLRVLVDDILDLGLEPIGSRFHLFDFIRCDAIDQNETDMPSGKLLVHADECRQVLFADRATGACESNDRQETLRVFVQSVDSSIEILVSLICDEAADAVLTRN